jgi:hypothetical protein
MSLTERLSELVRACFTGIWIESQEHDDAFAEISRLCHAEQWRVIAWDIEQGLRFIGAGQGAGDVSTGTNDPLAAIRALASLPECEQPTLLVLVNFHRFLQSAEIVQAVARQITQGKQNRTILVVLSPIVQIPAELEKSFIVVEHDLPGREQLQEIAVGVATEPGEMPTGQELDRLLDAAAGLTRMEAENAYSLSLVREGKLAADTVFEIKSQGLKKSGLLTLYRGSEDFTSLGGLASLKAFCKRSLTRSSSSDEHKRPRGVLLLGVPGTGKSAFAKALGNETGRPTISLDLGSLMGSLVGETEKNIRQALRIIDALSPCVAYLDEVEKSLAGVSGGGDSGVSARLFGTLLSWLNDHTSDAYVVCTCNDISKLPPEFSRAERFDGIFFLNLPSAEEREAIWQMYLRHFGLDASQRRPDDGNWTGAEIRACCRLAALLDLPLVQAAQNVVPVAVTAAESVERLKTWATGRCLDANVGGIYRKDSASTSTARRKVSRDPSNN